MTIVFLLTIFVMLIMGHFIADYPLQSDFIAKAKNPFRPVDPASIPPGQTPQLVWPWVLTAHAGVHALAVFLILCFFDVVPWLALIFALVEWIAHWVIDFGKCANLYSIHTDQIMHLLFKAIYAVVVVWLYFDFIVV